MHYERSEFYDPNLIVHSVADKLKECNKKNETIDYVTFVPDGEPTLDLNLGKEIAEVKKLGVPVALITNSSLMDNASLHKELMQLDWISLKIDSLTEETWRKIDRPHKRINFTKMLQGIIRFANNFKGKLTTETMLISGYNDSDKELELISNFLEKLEPQISYISIPTRPPAEKHALPANEMTLAKAYSIFAGKIPQVEHLIGYEGNEFGCSGDAYQDILSITAVHPMRKDAVEELLQNNQADKDVINKLINEGLILATEYHGHTYYVRKFREHQMG